MENHVASARAKQAEPRSSTISDVWRFIQKNGAVADIGQLTGEEVRFLKHCVRRGSLVKYRGHWDTHSTLYGVGPLKAIYALPSYEHS